MCWQTENTNMSRIGVRHFSMLGSKTLGTNVLELQFIYVDKP